MRQRVSATINRPADKVTCVHHWLIEPAIGPVSHGVCKRCGEQKDFLNILDDFESSEEISVVLDKKNSDTEDEDDES